MANQRVPSWVTLGNNEKIVWRGRPSHWVIARELLGGTAAVVVGISGVILLSDVWQMLPGVVGLIGLVYTGFVYFEHRCQLYLLTSTELYKRSGVFSQSVSTLRLDNVQNTTFTQSPVQRLLRFGRIEVETAGSDGTELVFEAVPNPSRVSRRITEQLDGITEYEQTR